MNPQKMKVNDIKVYLESVREKKHPRTGEPISRGEIKRTIGTLRFLVEHPYKKPHADDYTHNFALEHCLKLFPYLNPHVYQNRQSGLSDEQVAALVAASSEIDPDDIIRLRAYAIVSFAVFAGPRNKEAKLADVEDVDRNVSIPGFEDIEVWSFTVRHPKGEGTYGQVRPTLIEPEAYPVLKLWLDIGLPRWHRKFRGNIRGPSSRRTAAAASI